MVSNNLCNKSLWANTQSLIDWDFFGLWKDEYVRELQMLCE